MHPQLQAPCSTKSAMSGTMGRMECCSKFHVFCTCSFAKEPTLSRGYHLFCTCFSAKEPNPFEHRKKARTIQGTPNFLSCLVPNMTTITTRPAVLLNLWDTCTCIVTNLNLDARCVLQIKHHACRHPNAIGVMPCSYVVLAVSDPLTTLWRVKIPSCCRTLHIMLECSVG